MTNTYKGWPVVDGVVQRNYNGYKNAWGDLKFDIDCAFRGQLKNMDRVAREYGVWGRWRD